MTYPRVDIHTATAFRTPPSFPKINLDPSAPPLPDALLEDAAYTSPTSPLHLRVASIECFNIFYRLHRLALAISSKWITQVSRLTFSNLLYEMDYMLLSMPDHSRTFLDFDLETKDEITEDHAERAALADAASVTEGLLAAAQIFVYAALREVPPRARLFSILLERLRVALDRPGICTIRVWKDVKNSNLLLWALVVAASVAPAEGDRRWWVGKVCEVGRDMGVRSLKQLEGVLERVAWTDVFFGEGLAGVWQQVREVGRAMEVQGYCEHLGEGGIGGLEKDGVHGGSLGDGVSGVSPGNGDGYEDREDEDEGLEFDAGHWLMEGWDVA